MEEAMERSDEELLRDRNPEPTFSAKQSGDKDLVVARKIDKTHRTISSVYRLWELLSNTDVFLFGGRLRLSLSFIVKHESHGSIVVKVQEGVSNGLVDQRDFIFVQSNGAIHFILNPNQDSNDTKGGKSIPIISILSNEEVQRFAMDGFVLFDPIHLGVIKRSV
jgi:hypothetical protein